MQENLKPVLLTSIHDTERNEAAKKRREDLRIQGRGMIEAIEYLL